MDKWAELRTAYQVAKLGTISAAATALGFHRATVNRHIDVLEEEIGARIFIRHARGYTLTELGEDVLRVAQKTEELIEDLAGRVEGGKATLEGELKLTILAGFAELIMKPISDFRAENPNCIVHLDAGENLARLEYGEAHIALRAGPKPDHPDYVVSKFAQINFNLYAHQSYIQRFGMPKDTDDFDNHQFVLPPKFGGNLSVREWIQNIIRPDMIALSTQHVNVNFKAVLAGIGIGFIEDYKAKMFGGFHRVLAPNQEWSVPIWLVTHVDLHRTAKVQAMLRCIKSARQEE
ncbi:LysR family transcriptional regulator [Amylibacter sp.]|nr:LysR family transcriptional regulator [Amylibacter sp.]MDA9324488.1 LysR family transcriptional regulator [Amylibacter sp.]MDA9911117.1 LysR family transcriptional regulator [Amylibacter sp.]MDB2419087.1 LysR family transcriptional regulator [Amylibacter sp.]MDB4071463.1 LysR family transcriptional regulator [Amylibacter sp.]